MALGAGRGNYTPPAPVVALRGRLALIPALWANTGDAILIPDDFDPDSALYHEEAEMKNIRFMRLGDICGADLIAEPWGWNLSLRNALRRAGLRSPLPSDEYLATLRNLAHRRISRLFIQSWNEQRPDDEVELPVECKSMAEFEEVWNRLGNLFIKAPYSSAGRGVMRTAGSAPETVRRWAAGCIRRQGSVMAEKEMPHAFDFASEWGCEKGEATFLGWSVFSTSPEGRYINNNSGSQRIFEALIEAHTSIPVIDIVSVQKQILDRLIATHYHGLLGIDMLATSSGTVNPCVEINLRRTMGHLSLHSL